MTLQEALGRLGGPVVGTTSLIAGMLSGDLSPVAGAAMDRAPTDLATALAEAERQLARARQRQEAAESDWAYWGYVGQVAYYAALVSVLKAAQITGSEHLPDIEGPRRDGVVMDNAADMERWGEAVLAAARAGQEGGAT